MILFNLLAFTSLDGFLSEEGFGLVIIRVSGGSCRRSGIALGSLNILAGQNLFSSDKVPLGVSVHECQRNLDNLVVNKSSKNQKEEAKKFSDHEFLFAKGKEHAPDDKGSASVYC